MRQSLVTQRIRRSSLARAPEGQKKGGEFSARETFLMVGCPSPGGTTDHSLGRKPAQARGTGDRSLIAPEGRKKASEFATRETFLVVGCPSPGGAEDYSLGRKPVGCGIGV